MESSGTLLNIFTEIKQRHPVYNNKIISLCYLTVKHALTFLNTFVQQQRSYNRFEETPKLLHHNNQFKDISAQINYYFELRCGKKPIPNLSVCINCLVTLKMSTRKRSRRVVEKNLANTQHIQLKVTKKKRTTHTDTDTVGAG